MTPNDTKPEKAEASAVEVLRSLEWSGRSPAGESVCPQCDKTKTHGHHRYCRLAAALQSSSSAEAELRALLSSAKTTIALLMERVTDAEAERDALRAENEEIVVKRANDAATLSEWVEGFWRKKKDCDETQARVRVLEEALRPFAAEAEFYDPPEGDDDHVAWSVNFLIGQLRNARAALNHGKGEDARAAITGDE